MRLYFYRCTDDVKVWSEHAQDAVEYMTVVLTTFWHLLCIYKSEYIHVHMEKWNLLLLYKYHFLCRGNCMHWIFQRPLWCHWGFCFLITHGSRPIRVCDISAIIIPDKPVNPLHCSILHCQTSPRSLAKVHLLMNTIDRRMKYTITSFDWI